MNQPRRSSPAQLVCGFSLLEVIIALSLVSLLMVLAWSMFRVYTRLEEKGSYIALEQQLARGLTHQLRTDLHRIITPADSNPADSNPNPEPTTNSPLPDRVAMTGSANHLEFVIRVPTERWKGSAVEGGSPAMYQRVTYRFTPPGDRFMNTGDDFRQEPMDDRETSSQANPERSLPANASDTFQPDEEPRRSEPHGLVRDAYWLLPLDERGGTDEIDSSGQRELELAPALPAATEAGQLAEETFDDSRLAPEKPDALREEHDEVPEVSAWRFRYFDGQRWVLQWDSHAAGLLPAAVEVVFELTVRPPPEEASIDDAQTATETEEALLQRGEDTLAAQPMESWNEDPGSSVSLQSSSDDLLESDRALGAEQELLEPPILRFRTTVALASFLPQVTPPTSATDQDDPPSDRPTP